MTRTQRLWLVYGLAGLLVAALAVVLTISSDHEQQPALTIAIGFTVGWAFIGSGIVSRIALPENRTGALRRFLALAPGEEAHLVVPAADLSGRVEDALPGRLGVDRAHHEQERTDEETAEPGAREDADGESDRREHHQTEVGSSQHAKPEAGLEPTTHGLQNRCSTS